MIRNFLFPRKLPQRHEGETLLQFSRDHLRGARIGLVAGNGQFPLLFIAEAQRFGSQVIAACHEEETSSSVAELADVSEWVKVGELGRIISFFKSQNVTAVALAGGINRVRLFGNVKLDARGAALIMRVRSMKDDLLMRGIAEEFEREGLEVIPCTAFMTSALVTPGLIAGKGPSKAELEDIEIGCRALRAISSEHIGQTVVVREGVVVAVEAVEGTDKAIARGGELGGAGTVVVKCAKTTQDMRFDVPTVGVTTIENLHRVKARVLALESGRTIILDKDEVCLKAAAAGISIVGIEPLVGEASVSNDLR